MLSIGLLCLSACSSKNNQANTTVSSSSSENVQSQSVSLDFIKERLNIENDTSAGNLAIIDSGCAILPTLKPHILTFQDFVNHKTVPYDDTGHGTAITNIATHLLPNVHIIELKVLDSEDTASTDNLIKSLQWILTYHQKYNIKVINISISLPYNQEDDQKFQDIIHQLNVQGVAVVASSENFSRDKTLPANSQGVISVGSIDDKKTLSQVYTYGTGIETISLGGHLITRDGTSFSAVIMSSYVLYQMSQNPNFQIAQLKGEIK
ncbi:MAG: S8 family serine peptidase [Streptococcaceae bacterium]|nr:S8 family serine peptidase [Streptococcaceae bacterium]